MLGLATRAGKTVSGETQVLNAVRNGTARAVFISGEASAGTRKKFRDKCEYYKVPCFLLGSMDRLGASVGKTFRAVAAVTDEGFAKEIIRRLAGDDS